jgi:DNA-binding NtrC family response regulator
LARSWIKHAKQNAMTNFINKVFVIEDNIMFQQLIAYDLTTQGYQVTSFTKGEEAISNLHQSPQIVVLDYALNGKMDGMETLKAIKSINPNIQVIILSGQNNLGLAINMLKYGAFDYVEKSDHAASEIVKIIHRFAELQKETQAILQKKSFKRKGAILLGIVTIILTTAYSFIFKS